MVDKVAMRRDDGRRSQFLDVRRAVPGDPSVEPATTSRPGSYQILLSRAGSRMFMRARQAKECLDYAPLQTALSTPFTPALLGRLQTFSAHGELHSDKETSTGCMVASM